MSVTPYGLGVDIWSLEVANCDTGLDYCLEISVFISMLSQETNKQKKHISNTLTLIIEDRYPKLILNQRTDTGWSMFM